MNTFVINKSLFQCQKKFLHDVENKKLKQENEKVKSRKGESEKVESRKVEIRKVESRK